MCFHWEETAWLSCPRSLHGCPTRAGVGTESTLPASRTCAVKTLTALPFLPGSLVGPTKCEVERFAATRFRHHYVPSCRPDGEYQAAQCQGKGLCWCVDSRGQELPGTRRRGEPPSCGGCPLQASPLVPVRSCYCICLSRLTFPEHIHSIASQGCPTDPSSSTGWKPVYHY